MEPLLLCASVPSIFSETGNHENRSMVPEFPRKADLLPTFISTFWLVDQGGGASDFRICVCIFQARMEMGCHFLLQGIFLTQRSSPWLLCLQRVLPSIAPEPPGLDYIYHWATWIKIRLIYFWIPWRMEYLPGIPEEIWLPGGWVGCI